MTKSKLNHFISILFCFIVILFSIYLPIGMGYADGAQYPFDATDPLDDLESSENFDLSPYLWDTTGATCKPSIVNFVEWCYSPFKKGDFALYVYFYNPERLQIITNSTSNRIQMASAYIDEDKEPTTVITRDSIPSNYDTYQLLYCGMSMRTNYEGMFYKFRVLDKKTADGKTIEQRVNSMERRYDVAGITLADKHGSVKEYTVGGTYRFTGYAAGYGATVDSPSTLTNSGYTALETLRLEVHPTNYRVDGESNLGAGHQWDLTSVYFSVPEIYFTKYGNLQKVKAEWWEYKTQPIVAVESLNVYNNLKNYIGKDLREVGTRPKYYLFKYEDATYNYYEGYTYNVWHLNNGNPIYKLNYLFYTSNIDNDIIVSKEALETYVNNYNASYINGRINIGGNSLSADLFQGYVDDKGCFQGIVDEGRKSGYNCQEIDANDKVNLLSYSSSHSAWDNFWHSLGHNVSTEFTNISPINSDISAQDIALSDSSLSDVLLIDKNDASKFRAFYNNAKENGERTVIFHFAKTDYYAEKLWSTDGSEWVMTHKDANAAIETVFLDFKIIQLTFKDAYNNYKAIPVVSDPVDIYKDVSPALSPDYDWLNWLLGLGEDVAAWVIFIVSIFVGALLIWLLSKIIEWANTIGNPVIKLVFILAILAVFGALGYFGAIWVWGVISGLGGLL